MTAISPHVEKVIQLYISLILDLTQETWEHLFMLHLQILGRGLVPAASYQPCSEDLHWVNLAPCQCANQQQCLPCSTGTRHSSVWCHMPRSSTGRFSQSVGFIRALLVQFVQCSILSTNSVLTCLSILCFLL